MAQPRILFIRLGAIGDVVRTLPALRLVRRQFPEAFLGWVVEERSLAIVRGHPDLDEVLVLERDRLAGELSAPDTIFAGLARMGRFGRELRARSFTASLDFQGTFKSGLVSFAAGATTRAGYARAAVKEGNHLFTNVRVDLPPPPVHRVTRNLRLLQAIGVRAETWPEGAVVSLPIADADRSEADAAMRAVGLSDEPFVFIYPGSSRLQQYKRYPAAMFGEAARRLIAARCQVVVGPGPGEEEIANTMRSVAGPSLRVLPRTSLLAMAEIIKRARLFIGGDTGPMHMAWLQGVPVIALFGPTDPALNAPLGGEHTVLDALAGRVPGLQSASRPQDPSTFEALDPARISDAALARLEANRVRLDTRADLHPAAVK